mmetsp:Transcript_137163/g.273662  ORF Transcript_137163/g.273662 Transcript_137163/m.273662 type:complete len:280 (-) Transcript_137163:276-1115(-)
MRETSSTTEASTTEGPLESDILLQSYRSTLSPTLKKLVPFQQIAPWRLKTAVMLTVMAVLSGCVAVAALWAGNADFSGGYWGGMLEELDLVRPPPMCHMVRANDTLPEHRTCFSATAKAHANHQFNFTLPGNATLGDYQLYMSKLGMATCPAPCPDCRMQIRMWSQHCGQRSYQPTMDDCTNTSGHVVNLDFLFGECTPDGKGGANKAFGNPPLSSDSWRCAHQRVGFIGHFDDPECLGRNKNGVQDRTWFLHLDGQVSASCCLPDHSRCFLHCDGSAS